MLTRIYSNEEQTERAREALELNGIETLAYDPRYNPMLRAASSSIKPTIRIKRLNVRKSPYNIKLNRKSSSREYWRK